MTWTDKTLVERLAGDDQLARELVDIFLVEYPAMMAAIRSGISRQDGDAVRLAAHTLKGSVSNFIDGTAVNTARALEQAGGERRLADAASLMVRLEYELEELAAAMRQQRVAGCGF